MSSKKKQLRDFKGIKKKSMRALRFLNDPIDYGKSFSRGIRMDFGNVTILFISGTASVDAKGKTYSSRSFASQVKRTYDNITALLKSEGADWHDVVKTRCYLKDVKYYEEFNKHRNRFYKDRKLNPFPASVAIQAVLCRPDLLIEIEATAVFNNAKG